MRKSEYPKLLRSGSVVVKLYRVKHASTASGFAYTLGWTDQERKARRKQFADESLAETEGKQIARDLAGGLIEAAAMGREERNELLAIRELTGGMPPISAVREWRKAYDMTGGQILAACEAWSARNTPTFTPIYVNAAVDAFIASKDRAKKQGETTYRAKLKPLTKRFPDRYLNTLTATELGAYLETFPDAVTRNDIRKRTSSLFRWAQRAKHLPRFAPLEIAETERADEGTRTIGIVSGATYSSLLFWFKEKHPELLGAVVLAGFCGIRSDEIHGKRSAPEVRQLWSDVHLDRGFVQVTAAKKNTPAWRIVPLCPAAVEWLKLCPDQSGTLCAYGDLWKIRRLAKAAGFVLPANSLRHSFISHRIAVTGDKSRTSTEAGNSVKEIDKRYRVPLTAEQGAAWFSISPTDAAPANPPTVPVQSG